VSTLNQSRLTALAGRLEARSPDQRRWPRLRRRAAIAVVLRSGDQGIEVLLMRRVERRGDRWSGDIACPGGFAQAEETAVETAVREAEEELGIRLETSMVLGQLGVRPVRPWNHFADFQVTPVVFVIPPGPLALELAQAEVASARWVPLSVLGDPTRRQRFFWWWKFAKPVAIPFLVPRVWAGDYDVWGLTLRILDELVEEMR